jgi:hypothetical protein
MLLDLGVIAQISRDFFDDLESQPSTFFYEQIFKWQEPPNVGAGFAEDFFNDVSSTFQNWRKGFESLTESLPDLFWRWTDKETDDIQSRMLARLNDWERELFELGSTVDEGLRPSDIWNCFQPPAEGTASTLLPPWPEEGSFVPSNVWRKLLQAKANQLSLPNLQDAMTALPGMTWFEFVDRIDQELMSRLAIVPISTASDSSDESAVDWLESRRKVEPPIQHPTAAPAGEPSIAATPSEPDGPAGVYQWRLNGRLILKTMREGSWRLVKFLYPEGSATFDDLAEPINGDREEVPDSISIGSLRRDANSYFNAHGIPYKVSVSAKTFSVLLGRK